MENVALRIANEKAVLRQLFSLYGADPVTGLKEYVSNGVDAKISGQTVTIGIVVNKNDGTVIIQDNGLGMSYHKLRSLPESIGESASRLDPSKRGEKALGLLAFGGFGERATIVSRQYGGADPFGVLMLDKADVKASVRELTALNGLGPEFSHGTRVAIYGVKRQTIEHYFQPAKLRGALQEVYDPMLRRGELVLSVGWQGKTEKLESVDEIARRGVYFGDHNLVTPSLVVPKLGCAPVQGGVELYFFIDGDNSTGKIGVYNKGVRVIPSITSIREFNRSPWNSGRVDGSIDEDFCELIPSRDGYVRDQRFESLCALISSVEGELAARVSEAEKKARDTKLSESVSLLERALGETYRQNPPPWRKERKPAGGGGGCGGSSSSRKPTPRFGIIIEEFPLHLQDSRVRFDLDLEAVVINRAHPDYERHASGRDDDEALTYFASVVSKGAALGDYTVAREQHDQPVSPSDVPAIQERSSELFCGLLRNLGIFKQPSRK